MKATGNGIITGVMAFLLCVYVIMNIIPQRIETPEGAPAASVRKAHYLAHQLLLMMRGRNNPVLVLEVRERGRLRYGMTSYTAHGTDRDGDAVYYLRLERGILADLEEKGLAGAEWIEGMRSLPLLSADSGMLCFTGNKVYLLDNQDISSLVTIGHARSMK